MAITFQEKSNLGKNIAILIFMVALFFAVIFFIWRFLQENAQPPLILPPASSGIDVEILQDDQLAEMEIFPEITIVETEETRLNPFVEAAAASSENAVPTDL